jgi:hypothetical protein
MLAFYPFATENVVKSENRGQMATKKRTASRSLDIDSSFKFIFRDKEWLSKLAVAAVLLITIIGGFAVSGWALEVQQRVMKNKKVTPLPDWEPLGDYFVRGLKYSLLNLVWFLPLQLIYLLVFIPFFFLVLNSNGDPETISPQISIFFLALQPFSLIFTAVILMVQPVLSGLFSETNSFTQSFRVGHAVKIFRSNWKQFLGVSLLGYVASYAASLVGFALLCIGFLITMPAALAIAHHLYGQAYRNALAKAK